ncbi:MAG TPA: VWA domain-containing protein [Urbifossiella sp.]|jgi:Ca-activated chloride channel family protein
MSFPALPSGLTGLLADLRDFLLAMKFARPELFWLLLLLPILGLANRYAKHRRRRAAELLGRTAAIAGLHTQSQTRFRWLGLAYPLAWIALIAGLAGPRWGKSDEPGVAVGRDIVLLIDLSQSMKADDMASPEARTRWEAARAGLLDFMNAVSRRGGHRIAVIAFAARPKLLAPLTTDYDHVRSVIEEIDGRQPPPEVRPGVDPSIVSGTRIGSALIAAVNAHDPRFPGSQDIILISDGDDPGDDREWARGSDGARKAGIPVHTVGVGNPDAATIIIVGNPNNPELIQTKLEEDPLKQIAAETRGEYLAARRDVPRLGEFFRTRIEPFPSREVSDDSIPQPKERYPWFLGPALVLFAIGWFRGR